MKDYVTLVSSIARDDSVKLGKESPDFLQTKFDEMYTQKTNGILTSMGETLYAKLLALVTDIYSLSVNDQRVIIKGKSQNIAISLYNLQTLLNAKGDINHAARLAAYQFSDDFRKVSLVDGLCDIPMDECEFMNRYASFDKLSGWYNGEITFTNERDESGSYIGVIVSESLVSSPDIYSFTRSSGRTEYLEGYYLSLFNACVDLINVVSNAQGKAFSRKFATAVEDTKERLVGKTIYHILYSDTYISDWLQIDCAVYYLVDQLNNSKIDRTDIFEMAQAIRDIQELIQKNFSSVTNTETNDVFELSISVLVDKKLIDILTKIEETPDQIELNRYVLHCLLNEIRVFYEDLRIARLKR